MSGAHNGRQAASTGAESALLTGVGQSGGGLAYDVPDTWRLSAIGMRLGLPNGISPTGGRVG